MTYARLAAPAATPSGKLPDEPGFLDGYLLEQIGATDSLVLSLWEGDGDGTGHEVIDDWAGPSGGEPRAALVLFFDGPVSPAMYDAARYAARERIQPALGGVPGIVRLLALWRADTRAVTVVNLAESTDALEAAGRVVDATALLPGEDPALLLGPDRGTAYRVTRIRPAAPSDQS